MNNDDIRRQILQSLYDYEINKPDEGITNIQLKEEISIDENKFNFNFNYLKSKRLVRGITILGKPYYRVRITTNGIDVVENDEIDTLFPIIQNIVNHSPGTVINSDNVSINIQESFNQIYQEIAEMNTENKSEIIVNVNKLKEELEKDNINKSKVQECSNWLKRNANWTIPTVTQIILSTMGL
jgi:hypothetical protein